MLDDNPLHHEPGQEKNESEMNTLYNEVIKYDSINTLIIKNMVDPPERFYIFIDNMKEEFDKYKQNIQDFLLKKKGVERRKITVSFYRIQTILDYQLLLNNYNYMCK